MTTATAPTQAVLTAGDRCDRCGAQAYLRVELQSGGELLFCAHHAREHGDKLREVAAAVHDETHKLGTRRLRRRRRRLTADPHRLPPRPRTRFRGRVVRARPWLWEAARVSATES